MLYTLLLCAFAFFALIGMMSLLYLCILHFKKPKRTPKCAIIMPLCENEKENAGKIGYAAERINLFGEDENIEIWAVCKEENRNKELENMFQNCKCVKFIQEDCLCEMYGQLL